MTHNNSFKIYLDTSLDKIDTEAVAPLLSVQRREQMLSISHTHGRQACAAVYLLLCEGLRRDYGITTPPTFVYGAHGKPLLRDTPMLHFSFSHCREAALCVIAQQPVGCDIESIGRYKESLARYTMNDSELNEIMQSANSDVTFTELWTKKEALLKMTGQGLQGDIKNALAGGEDFLTVVDAEKGFVYSVITQENSNQTKE